jgi:hypothetical protein
MKKPPGDMPRGHHPDERAVRTSWIQADLIAVAHKIPETTVRGNGAAGRTSGSRSLSASI